ncbi:MAG TPA: hypothetical protein PLJ60_11820 [Chryseolinea sp.]|nr:hypothetical protein [Chryseolinea sp.]HPM31011.1 hypothetical protein [Chryseolinea sp.]
MEEEKNDGEKWVDDLGNLVETYRNLITIRVVEHTSLGASLSALGILSLIFLLCILLFFGLGAAWWIGELMQNRTAGFFIVGGIYFFLLGGILLMARKFIVPLIRNLIIKKIYDQD